MKEQRALLESSLTTAENSLGMLPQEERKDAEALLEFCRAHWMALSEPAPSHEGVKLEVARLVEFLARRSAKAMPYAALGRALLADLNASSRDRDLLFREFQAKMSLWGL